MTSTKGPGLLALLAGAAVALAAAVPGRGQPPESRLGTLIAFDDKGDPWDVVRDGDRFVALRFRQGDGISPRNFHNSGDFLRVDDRSLGYDLGGKNHDVLALDRRGPDTEDIRWDIGPWEVVAGREGELTVRRFRVAHGALKGWWVGLGPAEPPQGDRRPRARLVLVKDKKDAAGFRWTTAEDE
jgi:hypothetical protein